MHLDIKTGNAVTMLKLQKYYIEVVFIYQVQKL